MPDDVKDAQTKDEGDTQELPIPDISAGSVPAGSEMIGFDAAAFESRMFERLDQIEESLPDLVDRRFKSDKDKRFVKLAKADEILAAVEAAGGDPEKIRGQLETDALLNRIEALEQGSGGAGGTAPAEDAQKQKLQDETAELLREAKAEHGIDISDEELKELAESKDFRSPLEWRNAVSSLIVKTAKQGNIGAGASAGASGAAATPSDDDELLLNMETLMKYPVRNEIEIRKLKAEAVKRGLLQ